MECVVHWCEAVKDRQDVLLEPYPPPQRRRTELTSCRLWSALLSGRLGIFLCIPSPYTSTLESSRPAPPVMIATAIKQSGASVHSPCGQVMTVALVETYPGGRWQLQWMEDRTSLRASVV